MMARTGSTTVLLLGLLTTVAMIYPIAASDPDLTTDFGINSTTATAANFTFQGFRNRSTPGLGMVQGVPASFAKGLPGLTGLGLFAVQFEFGPMSQVDPHHHPRASEIFLVLSGSVDVGFVDTSNVLYETTLEAGDAFVFPKAQLHYQRNNCNASALGYSVLSSENPGGLFTAEALFNSTNGGLPNIVLATALRTSEENIQNIKNNLA